MKNIILGLLLLALVSAASAASVTLCDKYVGFDGKEFCYGDRNIDGGPWTYQLTEDHDFYYVAWSDGDRVSLPKNTYTTYSFGVDRISVHVEVKSLLELGSVSKEGAAEKTELILGSVAESWGKVSDHIYWDSDYVVYYTYPNATKPTETLTKEVASGGVFDQKSTDLKFVADTTALTDSFSKDSAEGLVFDFNSYVINSTGGSSVWSSGTNSNTAQKYADGTIVLNLTHGDYSAYWSFDDATGTKLTDENRTNNGTTNATWNPNGKFDYAGDFDGVTTGVALSHWNWPYPGYGAVCLWVYPTSNGSGVSYTAFDKDNLRFSFTMSADVNRKVTYNIRAAAAVNCVSTSKLTLNQWTHLCGTYNGSHGKLYVNGGLDCTTSATSAGLDNTTLGTTIGRKYNGAAPWNGSIDEVVVFMDLPTEDEINQTMNNTRQMNGNWTSADVDAGAGNVITSATIHLTNQSAYSSGTDVDFFTNCSGTMAETTSILSGTAFTIAGCTGRWAQIKAEMSSSNSSLTPEIENITLETGASCTTPTDDLYLNSDTTLCAGTYQLNDTGDDGIIRFNASNIVLNCNAAIIQGNSSGTDNESGIGITSVNFANNTVHGCTITDYSYGIYFYGYNYSADNNKIYDNTLTNNTENGIYLRYESFDEIHDNTLTSNSYHISGSSDEAGIQIHEGNYTIIKNNTLYYEWQGIRVVNSFNNNVSTNKIYDGKLWNTSGTAYHDIMLESTGTNDNIVEYNNISGGYASIELYNPNYRNILRFNRIFNSSDIAINLRGPSTYNTVVNNNTIDNATGGIESSHGQFAVIENNTLSNITSANAALYIVGGSGVYDNNATVRYNHIEDCTNGLSTKGTHWNNFSRNTIVDSTTSGILIQEDSENNTFGWNNITDAVNGIYVWRNSTENNVTDTNITQVNYAFYFRFGSNPPTEIRATNVSSHNVTYHSNDDDGILNYGDHLRLNILNGTTWNIYSNSTAGGVLSSGSGNATTRLPKFNLSYSYQNNFTYGVSTTSIEIGGLRNLGIYNATVTEQASGGVQWYNCTDTDSDGDCSFNTNISDNTSLTTVNLVDTTGTLAGASNTAPGILLNSPLNGSIGQNANPILNVTITDNDSATVNCTFVYSAAGGNTTLQSNLSVANGTTLTYNWTGRAFNTTYNWIVNCSDGSLTGTTANNSFTTANFAIGNLAPADLHTTNNPISVFYYNVSGTETTYDCNATVDDTEPGSNATAANNTLYGIWTAALAEGPHRWNISCCAEGFCQTSATRTVTYSAAGGGGGGGGGGPDIPTTTLPILLPFLPAAAPVDNILNIPAGSIIATWLDDSLGISLQDGIFSFIVGLTLLSLIVCVLVFGIFIFALLYLFRRYFEDRRKQRNYEIQLQRLKG